MATPALKQSATAASSAAAPASITPTLGVASVAGNLLLLVVVATGATNVTISTPTSWTTIASPSNNSLALLIAAFPNNPGGITAVAVTLSNTTAGGAVAVLMELTGFTAGATLDSFVGSALASSNAPLQAFSTQAPTLDELVLGVIGFQAASVNNLIGTSIDLLVSGTTITTTLVSTVATTNAQVIVVIGISIQGIISQIQASLASAVAIQAHLSRYFSSNSESYSMVQIAGRLGALITSLD